jgi:beta-phosphoglucomutase-like phosphatase (HAD superfamily)
VTAHLRTALAPDPEVIDALTRLSGRFALAAVSSSAEARLEACFRATGLAGFFPPARRFSAEDSLPRPTSKPDPAIYRHALARMGVDAGRALAIEDAAPGVEAAVGAGCPTIGHLAFVPPPERPGRQEALAAAGAAAVTTSWRELADVLLGGGDVVDTSDRDTTMTAPAEPLPAPRRRSDDEVREAAARARTRDPTTPTAPAAG